MVFYVGDLKKLRNFKYFFNNWQNGDYIIIKPNMEISSFKDFSKILKSLIFCSKMLNFFKIFLTKKKFDLKIFVRTQNKSFLYQIIRSTKSFENIFIDFCNKTKTFLYPPSKLLWEHIGFVIASVTVPNIYLRYQNKCIYSGFC